VNLLASNIMIRSVKKNSFRLSVTVKGRGNLGC